MELVKISELETATAPLNERSFLPVDVNGETLKVAATNLIKCGEYTVTLPAARWNSSNHKITVAVSNVTPTTTQIIFPLAATSADNIANNKALQKANLQDAGQSTGVITLYAEKIPTTDLNIRVVVYV